MRVKRQQSTSDLNLKFLPKLQGVMNKRFLKENTYIEFLLTCVDRNNKI